MITYSSLDVILTSSNLFYAGDIHTGKIKCFAKCFESLIYNSILFSVR